MEMKPNITATTLNASPKITEYVNIVDPMRIIPTMPAMSKGIEAMPNIIDQNPSFPSILFCLCCQFY